MSSDEMVSENGANPNPSQAIEGATSPESVSDPVQKPAGESAETSGVDNSAKSEEQTRTEHSVGTAVEESPAPARRLRLNPTVNPKEFKAVPTMKTLGAGATRPAAAESPAAATSSTPAPQASQQTTASTGSATAGEANTADASSATESVSAETAADPAAHASASPKAKPPKPERKLAPPPVEIPPAIEQLDNEMEAEIEAALSSGELDMPQQSPAAISEAVSKSSEPISEETLEAGAHLAGRIQSVSGDNVFLDLGVRSPGVVSSRQFTSGKKPEVGQLIEVIVEKFDPAEGLVLVNLPRGMRKVAGNWESLSKGQVIECVVNKTNKGGLEVTVGGLRGFLPSSQIELGFVGDLEQYIGQKLRVEVVEVNPKKRNLVVSRRAQLQVERQEAAEKMWTTLEVGQTMSGTVKTLKDYGAFIDLGGVDGFLHVGEISWQRIQKPSDILQEGQQVEVKILALNPDTKKISLGMRQLAQNPWTTAAAKYGVGTKVSGKVTRVADFGAFVELEPGLEGLIHVSEIDYKHVRRVADVLKPHQVVEAQVLEVDTDRKRVSLSLKALMAKPETEKPDEDQAPSGGEVYQRKRKEPLKGGTGSSSGGGLFGNPRDFGK